MAARPSAIARCVLPTPGGPRRSSASPCATQRQAASSRIWRGSSEGWAAKSKPSRVALLREVGDLPRHRDAPLVLARDLALTKEGERLTQGELAPRRFVDEVVELIANGGELEARQPTGEGLMVDGHDQPPPATLSYSASGRSSAGVGSAVDTGLDRGDRARGAGDAMEVRRLDDPLAPTRSSRHGPRSPPRHGEC